MRERKRRWVRTRFGCKRSGTLFSSSSSCSCDLHLEIVNNDQFRVLFPTLAWHFYDFYEEKLLRSQLCNFGLTWDFWGKNPHVFDEKKQFWSFSIISNCLLYVCKKRKTKSKFSCHIHFKHATILSHGRQPESCFPIQFVFALSHLYCKVPFPNREIWIYHCPGLRNVYFWHPSLAQKRSLLKTSIEGHVACFTLTHCCLFVSSDNEDSPGSSNFHGNKYDGDDDLVIDWQE